MLIHLHGISSSGKSTIATELAKRLNNAIIIDQDSFYKSIKPMISFHTYKAANWDTVEAIDMIQFNHHIKEALKRYNYVIVTGFALRDMDIKADMSILLYVEDINKIIEGRRHSKKYNGDKAMKDYYMVKEVVWPYYLETLKKISYDYVIDVYDKDERIELNKLVNKILQPIIYKCYNINL